jgi:hypothetical protein
MSPAATDNLKGDEEPACKGEGEAMADQEYIDWLKKSEAEVRFSVQLSCKRLAELAGRYAAKADSLSQESSDGDEPTSDYREFREIRKLLTEAENSFNRTVQQHEAALINLREALRG